MDTPPRSIQSDSEGPSALDWPDGLLVTGALLFAITHQSLWIDETTIGVAAKQSSLRDVWLTVFAARTTELQSPFFMVYIWTYARVFGTSEWALRASNLLWLIPGLIIFLQSFRQRLDRLCLAVAVSANACIWYYTGEARMYAMLLGTSSLVFAGIHQLNHTELTPRQQSKWLSVLLAGLVLLCGTTLLGAVWSTGAFMLILFLWPRRRFLELGRCGPVRIAVAFCALLMLAAYYFWTLRLGTRATAFAKTDWRSIGFIVYEQLGFAGLGPGRTDLRIGGVGLLRPYATGLLAYALLAGTVTICGVIELAKRLSLRRLAALVLAFAVPTILLLSIGASSHWRVLGRHCIVLMSGWVTLVGFGLAGLWRLRNCAWKAVGVAFVVMALWSCAAIRFAARHQRDDYRDAAKVVQAALARGGIVWWNAVGDGANYYQVPLATNAPETGRATLLVNVTTFALAGMTPPDLVAVSKPELFDIQGGVAAYLAEHHYRPAERFAAFTIWRP